MNIEKVIKDTRTGFELISSSQDKLENTRTLLIKVQEVQTNLATLCGMLSSVNPLNTYEDLEASIVLCEGFAAVSGLTKASNGATVIALVAYLAGTLDSLEETIQAILNRPETKVESAR